MSNPNLNTFQSVMAQVYGECKDPKNWTPKPYLDNKSRYLWTDAFGVCNFLTLYYETGDQKYLLQADALIQNVHEILGKNRDGKSRLGNATDSDPLLGGLRIGKIDPEGSRDGDGQYFHYLTKWAFALNRMSIAKKEPNYNRLAIQLIKSIHPHFIKNSNTSEPRMYWKVSIDLSHPVVQSEGNLDPFDGYITYKLVQSSSPDPNILKSELQDMRKMVENKYPRYVASPDPLDLGEALWLCHWVQSEPWAKRVIDLSLATLEVLWSKGYFEQSEKRRLAFREFGTTMGVQALKCSGWVDRVHFLNGFWKDRLMTRDGDITPVMFCTSLIPGVFVDGYVK